VRFLYFYWLKATNTDISYQKIPNWPNSFSQREKCQFL